MNNDILDEKEVMKTAPSYLGKPWGHVIVILLFVVIVVFSFLSQYFPTQLSPQTISLELFIRSVLLGGVYYFLIMLIFLIRNAIQEGGGVSEVVRYFIFTPIVAGLGTVIIVIFMLFFTAIWYLLFFFLWQFAQPDVLEVVSPTNWFYMNMVALLLGLCTIHYIMYRKLLSE